MSEDEKYYCHTCKRELIEVDGVWIHDDIPHPEIFDCPKCGGSLDVGGECNDCDYDTHSKDNFVNGFSKLAKSGDKIKIAEFLRNNKYGKKH